MVGAKLGDRSERIRIESSKPRDPEMNEALRDVMEDVPGFNQARRDIEERSQHIRDEVQRRQGRFRQ